MIIVVITKGMIIMPATIPIAMYAVVGTIVEVGVEADQ